MMLAAELVEREAVRLTGAPAGKALRGMREEQESYCCRKCGQCPRKDSCFPEEE